jgi:hypothetical protein
VTIVQKTQAVKRKNPCIEMMEILKKISGYAVLKEAIIGSFK